MSSTYKMRHYQQVKQNNIKYQLQGSTKLLVICLNYQGTQAPLTCITDGKRIIEQAKATNVPQIHAIFDDGSTDLYPTKINVLNKMRELASSCMPGDFLVVYYSGHGTNVPDVSQTQSDGQDQAFCLRTQDQTGFQFLTDDQTSKCISKYLGDNIPCLFIVDACHSGTILDLTQQKLWQGKKVFCISGCQDNQYSNDTGDGGQMTNILLAILRENQYKRKSKSLSLQYIFNRMVLKNQQIQGKYADDPEKKKLAYKNLHKSGPSFFSMCWGSLQLCMAQSNIKQVPNYFQIMQNYKFDDQPGEHEDQQDEAQPGQWINLSWNGGSHPTKIPFPL